MRIEVFNGWVELRDPELVPERLRRPVVEQSIRATQFADLDMDSDDLDPQAAGDAIAFFSELNDILSVALISEWSFNEPISIDGLLNLSSKTYDDIRREVSPFVSKLLPDFGVTDDPKAITEQ